MSANTPEEPLLRRIAPFVHPKDPSIPAHGVEVGTLLNSSVQRIAVSGRADNDDGERWYHVRLRAGDARRHSLLQQPHEAARAVVANADSAATQPLEVLMGDSAAHPAPAMDVYTLSEAAIRPPLWPSRQSARCVRRWLVQI